MSMLAKVGHINRFLQIQWKNHHPPKKRISLAFLWLQYLERGNGSEISNFERRKTDRVTIFVLNGRDRVDVS